MNGLKNDRIATAAACPACGHQLSRAEQASMTTPLGSSQPIECPACKRRIRWQASTDMRMAVGNLMFRVGSLAALVCGSGVVLAPERIGLYGVLTGIGALIAIAGISLNRTSASRSRVKLMPDDV